MKKYSLLILLICFTININAVSNYVLSPVGEVEKVYLEYGQALLENKINTLPQDSYQFTLLQQEGSLTLSFSSVNGRVGAVTMSDSWSNLRNLFNQAFEQIKAMPASVATTPQPSTEQPAIKDASASVSTVRQPAMEQPTVQPTTTNTEQEKEFVVNQPTVVVAVPQEKETPMQEASSNNYQQTDTYKSINNESTVSKIGKYYQIGSQSLTDKQYAAFLQRNCPEAWKSYLVGKKLCSAGWALLGSGIGLCVIGGALMGVAEDSSTSYYSYYYGYVHHVDYSMLDGGVALVSIGAIATGASIPCIAIGYVKKNKSCNIYNENCAKRQNVAYLNLISSSNGLGLALSF